MYFVWDRGVIRVVADSPILSFSFFFFLLFFFFCLCCLFLACHSLNLLHDTPFSTLLIIIADILITRGQVNPGQLNDFIIYLSQP